jgi:hypothetical protein
MPAYQYVALSRLKVGDGYREPGEPVPEASMWPNLRHYISTGQVEEIPVPDGVKAPLALLPSPTQ